MTRGNLSKVTFLLMFLMLAILGCDRFGLFRPAEFKWETPWIGDVAHEIVAERDHEADIRVSWVAYIPNARDAEVECRIKCDSREWTNWSTARRSYVFEGLGKGDHESVVQARTVTNQIVEYEYPLTLCLDGGPGKPEVTVPELDIECVGNGYGRVTLTWQGTDDQTPPGSLRYRCVIDGTPMWSDWSNQASCTQTLESIGSDAGDELPLEHVAEVYVRDICDREGMSRLSFTVDCKVGNPPRVDIQTVHSVCEGDDGLIIVAWIISDDDSSEVDLHSWWKLEPYMSDWRSIPITDNSYTIRHVPNGHYTFWLKAQDRFLNTGNDHRDVSVACPCD